MCSVSVENGDMNCCSAYLGLGHLQVELFWRRKSPSCLPLSVQLPTPYIQIIYIIDVKMSDNLDKLHSDLFNAGLQNRREVVGDSYVDNALRNGSSEFAYPGQQLVTEYVSFT